DLDAPKSEPLPASEPEKQPLPPPAPQDSAPPVQESKPQPTADASGAPAETPAEPPQPQRPEESSKPKPPATEPALTLERLVLSRLAADGMRPALDASLPGDPMTRRGFALYLAGAAGALVRLTGRRPEAETELLSIVLPQMGLSTASI